MRQTWLSSPAQGGYAVFSRHVSLVVCCSSLSHTHPYPHPLITHHHHTTLQHRYCMDSLVDPSDWRRKSYEVCFEAKIKDLHLESICLACARFCLSSLRLVPKVRVRSKGNTKCFCKMSGMCVCYWSVIRSKFDLTADEDGCIVPNQISKLLRNLRAPAPIEVEDIEEALISLFDGASGDADSPKVKAVPFEKWYRVYYDEYDDDAKS